MRNTTEGAMAPQDLSWWSASDRWIPPQRMQWPRPLLARLKKLAAGFTGRRAAWPLGIPN